MKIVGAAEVSRSVEGARYAATRQSSPWLRAVEAGGLRAKAVQGPQRPLWPDILEKIAELTGSGCTVLLANNGHARVRDLTAFTRTDLGFLEQYVRYYESVNPWVAPCNRLFADGSVRYGHRVVSEGALEGSEFYNDFLRREKYFHSFGIKIPLHNLTPVYLTSLRTREMGPYQDADGTVLSTLLPHLQRALRLSFEFSLLGTGMQAAFEALRDGLLLLNKNGDCLLMNKAAQEFVDRKDALVLYKSRLAALNPAEATQLREMISRAIQPGAARLTQGTEAILISRKRGRPLHVVVSPHLGGLTAAPSCAAAVVYVRNPDSASSPRAEVLRALFGLTKSEARLLKLLLEGRKVSEAADINGVSRETVRSQLKSVLQKTGTRGQSDLVRTLSGFASG